MDVLAARELTIDLSLWRGEAEVAVVTPGAVTVGHVADELTRFLNMPSITDLGTQITYSLLPASEATDASEPDELDRDQLVADLDGGAVALVADVQSWFDRAGDDLKAKVTETATELEADIRAKIDEEIDRWIGKGRALVVGALDDAMDEIRERLPGRIAGLIPAGRRGVVAQYVGSRTVKRFATTQHRPGYRGAVRTGLAMARRSTNVMFRFAGRVAASIGGGGVAGAGLGGASGAAAGAGTGATAGAAAGVAVVVAAVAAVALAPGGPPKWFVEGEIGDGTSPEGAAGIDARLAETGENDDLLLDLSGNRVYVKADDTWRELNWLSAGTATTVPRETPTTPSVTLETTTTFLSPRMDAGMSEPEDSNDADLYVDRCNGLLYGRDADGKWQRLVGFAPMENTEPTQQCSEESLAGAGSLWRLVSEVCNDQDGRRAPNSEVVREVGRTWSANLDVIGSDPNALPSSGTIMVKCE